ncbi:MAG: TetR/AcrR family transcriptional regulator, partial [Limnobacter sp.]|nr:TetR/AcrR family transcriptional regulator [Limnobacter sp.]
MTQATRQNLLEIGADVFMRQGYNSTGLSALLKRADVPKGSFYHYFKSKEDFGVAVVEEFSSKYLEHMDRFFANTTLPPLERLAAYFADGIEFMNCEQCKAGCLFGSLGQEMSSQNEALRHHIDKAMAAQAKRIRACLDEAMEENQLS